MLPLQIETSSRIRIRNHHFILQNSQLGTYINTDDAFGGSLKSSIPKAPSSAGGDGDDRNLRQLLFSFTLSGWLHAASRHTLE